MTSPAPRSTAPKSWVNTVFVAAVFCGAASLWCAYEGMQSLQWYFMGAEGMCNLVFVSLLWIGKTHNIARKVRVGD